LGAVAIFQYISKLEGKEEERESEERVVDRGKKERGKRYR